MKKLTKIMLAMLTISPFFIQTVFADVIYEREIGCYVVREDDDHFVSDANAFLKHFWSGVTRNDKRWSVGQYYWNYPRLFMEDHQSFVDKMDLALVRAHGANYLISTLKNCCDVIHFKDCPGYGDYAASNGDLEFLIIGACSPLPAPPDAGYADVPNWFKTSNGDATGIFQGLHQLMSFRTGASGGASPNYYDEFGERLAQGNAVMLSWFDALNVTRNHHGGGEYPGYGSAISADGLTGDTLFVYGADPDSIHNGQGYTIFWQE